MSEANICGVVSCTEVRGRATFDTCDVVVRSSLCSSSFSPAMSEANREKGWDEG